MSYIRLTQPTYSGCLKNLNIRLIAFDKLCNHNYIAFDKFILYSVITFEKLKYISNIAFDKSYSECILIGL